MQTLESDYFRLKNYCAVPCSHFHPSNKHGKRSEVLDGGETTCLLDIWRIKRLLRNKRCEKIRNNSWYIFRYVRVHNYRLWSYAHTLSLTAMLTVSHNVDITVTTISVTLTAFTCAERLFEIYIHDIQMYSGISIRLWSLENIVNTAIASYIDPGESGPAVYIRSKSNRV